MNLTVSLEARFLKTTDQAIWTETGLDNTFWQRYLDVFDSVEVVARVQDISRVLPNHKRADGERIHFIPLPYYIGPYQYLLNAFKIDQITKAIIKKAEVVLLRTPGQVSHCLFRHLKNNQHPYGVEVVGDPYDVFAPGVIDHPFRLFFRWWSTRQLCNHCQSALGAAYVTKDTLQRRYPNALYSTYYSSIDIKEEAYATSPRIAFGLKGFYTLVFIGSLEQLYKGPDLLIDAVGLCNRRNLNIKLNIIGEGRFKPQLKAQVSRKGLSESVTFMGQLPAGGAVRDMLMKSDLFVLPSRTEGLPRAMIEAMACGLPCIGSNIGGIPELLSQEDLVPAGNAPALAEKIGETITQPHRMMAMAARNLEKSKEYRSDILDKRRQAFYLHLRNKTEEWLQERREKH